MNMSFFGVYASPSHPNLPRSQDFFGATKFRWTFPRNIETYHIDIFFTSYQIYQMYQPIIISPQSYPAISIQPIEFKRNTTKNMEKIVQPKKKKHHHDVFSKNSCHPSGRPHNGVPTDVIGGVPRKGSPGFNAERPSCSGWTRESRTNHQQLYNKNPTTSWWLNQPIWKILVKMGIFPK